MMARINLSIDDDLFDLLKDDADGHNCTVNVYLVRRELFVGGVIGLAERTGKS